MLDEVAAGAGPVGPRPHPAGAGDAAPRPPEPFRADVTVRLGEACPIGPSAVRSGRVADKSLTPPCPRVD
ncbi:hypothetical protein ACTWQJ_50400, partial [Streptomyces sp. KR55]